MLILFILLAIFIAEELVRGALKAKDKKRYLVKNGVGLVVVVLMLFLFGPLVLVSPLKPGFKVSQDGRAVLYHQTSLPQDKAAEILGMIKQAELDNERFFGSSKTLPVYAVSGPLNLLRLGAQPKAGGIGSSLGIVVNTGKASSNVIAHEMSHRNLSIAVGKLSLAFPRWFDEGLASYIGKMNYYKKPEDLKRDWQQGIYLKDLFEWKGLGGLLKWHWYILTGQNPRQLYGQVYLMTKYLFDYFGEDKVREFLILNKAESFKPAFEMTFGMTQTQFNDAFVQSFLKD